MITKLSRKDIKMLESSAKNDVSKCALKEYLSAHRKAETAWKVFRDSLILSEGSSENSFSKEVKSEKARKFKAGDEVRVLTTEHPLAYTENLNAGNVVTVAGYKGEEIPWNGGTKNTRPVLVGSHSRGNWGHFEESALELVVEEEKSPNELRAEIIEKAKKVLEMWKRNSFAGLDDYQNSELGFPYKHWSLVAEFVINPEKRTVVALLKGHETLRLATKSIAKCAHDDVFNEHIGKAIALGRALGKDVSEFENAVQPTKVVVGHSISSISYNGERYEYQLVTGVEDGVIYGVDSRNGCQACTRETYGDVTPEIKITNDTDAIYGGIV